MSRGTLKELINEVKSDLSKYDDAGLLDEISMYKDAIRALRKLGNDSSEYYETVIEVKDGIGTVPANYRTLYAAYLCKPLGYKRSPEVEEHELQSSHFYVERTTTGNTWNECDGCCNEVTESVIKENFYFKTNKAAEFYYNCPTLLRLGKTFHRNSCHKECRNKYVKDNPNEIIIVEDTLKANFNEGHIYMMYYGLPQDDEGNITYPEDKNGHIGEYIEYAIKKNTAERLMANKDDEGLRNLYGIFEKNYTIAYKNSKNTLKMGKITPSTFRRWQRLNQLDSFQYESALTYKGGDIYSVARPVNPRRI